MVTIVLNRADLNNQGKVQFVYTEGVRSSSLLPPNTDGKPLSEEGGFHFGGRENGVSSIHVLFPRGKDRNKNGGIQKNSSLTLLQLLSVSIQLVGRQRAALLPYLATRHLFSKLLLLPWRHQQPAQLPMQIQEGNG